MTSDSERIIIEGIAAAAVTLAEMGKSRPQFDEQITTLAASVGATAEQIRLAADEIARMPQPVDESAEERERGEPIRQMLGVMPVEEQLVAELRAREWLQALADRTQFG